MLSARKVELLAGLKVRGLELRNRELDFYMIRFTMTAGLSSMMTMLAYIGIIKIKIPEPMREGFWWQVATFYVCACLAMVTSLYNLVLTSFSMVQGQGLALRGPPGSLAKAVLIFQEQWRVVRLVLVMSLLSIVLSGALCNPAARTDRDPTARPQARAAPAPWFSRRHEHLVDEAGRAHRVRGGGRVVRLRTRKRGDLLDAALLAAPLRLGGAAPAPLPPSCAPAALLELWAALHPGPVCVARPRAAPPPLPPSRLLASAPAPLPRRSCWCWWWRCRARCASCSCS